MSGHVRFVFTDDESRDVADARIDYMIQRADRFGDREAAAEMRLERLANALRGFRYNRRWMRPRKTDRLVGTVSHPGVATRRAVERATKENAMSNPDEIRDAIQAGDITCIHYGPDGEGSPCACGGAEKLEGEALTRESFAFGGFVKALEDGR